MVLKNFHPREEVTEMVRDEVFDRDEAQPATPVIRELNESGKQGRHFEPGKLDLVRFGVAHPNREVEGQPRDVGKRVGRVHSERHEDGENLFRKNLVNAGAVSVAEVSPDLNVNSGLIERWLHLVLEDTRVA